MQDPNKRYVECGTITAAHGLHGHITVYLDEIWTNLDKAKFLFIMLAQHYIPYLVTSYTQNNRQALLKLQEVDSRTEAKKLVGYTLWFLENQDNKLHAASIGKEKNFVGYQAIDSCHGLLGEIIETIQFPRHQCFLVLYRKKELLIPYAEPLIKCTNDIEKTITLQLPDNFLETLG